MNAEADPKTSSRKKANKRNYGNSQIPPRFGWTWALCSTHVRSDMLTFAILAVLSSSVPIIELIMTGHREFPELITEFCVYAILLVASTVIMGLAGGLKCGSVPVNGYTVTLMMLLLITLVATVHIHAQLLNRPVLGASTGACPPPTSACLPPAAAVLCSFAFALERAVTSAAIARLPAERATLEARKRRRSSADTKSR